MSVNQAWQGRRFRTDTYDKYILDLLSILPEVTIPEGELVAYYEFGLSSKLADWDNPIKPLQDILQKKYGFDDKRIMEAKVVKIHVAKGQEYLKFAIESRPQGLLGIEAEDLTEGESYDKYINRG
jgi:Holliday junction resolvase RusA-like endonuclease